MQLILRMLLSVACLSAVMGQVQFVDVTTQAGIRFAHQNGAFGKKLLPETMGSGVAFLDYDGDGWLDIFLVNSSVWPGRDGTSATSRLYRNNGDGTFSDTTRAAGLAFSFYGIGVSAADFDNDGDLDLYLSGLGPDRLLRNEAGKFTDVTLASGISNPDFGTSSAWFDYDRDGLLDLFVANYVQWSMEEDIFCSLDGTHKSYCTPESYQGSSPRLFRNLGGGRFEDVTRAAGMLDDRNKGLGVLVFDYNLDGWSDVMLANDTVPNKLWENNGDKTFSEVGVLAGVALSEDGVARGAMGIDAGDYDRSGRPSIVIGNFSNEMMALYHNEGNGFFIDEAPVATVGPASLLTLSFGCFFFDFNLDGLLDIYSANGHVETDIQAVQKRVTYRQPAHLFANLDGRKFQEVTGRVGEALAVPRVGRGAAYGDYDNDGDPDILLSTSGGSAHLFRNDGGNRNNWVSFLLEGSGPNRNGIGARITVRTGDHTQTASVRTGGSYASQSQLRTTLGLGQLTKIDSVTIRWPGGETQNVDNVRINRIHRITRR